jgi:PPOX class probable F420-dependent enzyme
MDLDVALRWAADHKHATLITIRSDGRPQSSDIVYRLADGAFVVSVTANRAKTVNMGRDPRVVLHISDPASWSYLSFDGTASLSSVAVDPADDTSNALVDYYRAVAGEDHSDWPAYRTAMIDEQRLLVTIRPESVVGQIRNA